MAVTLMQKRKEWKANDDSILVNLKCLMGCGHFTQVEMAQMLGMNVKTFRKNMLSPERFTVKDLRMISFLAESRGIPQKTMM